MLSARQVQVALERDTHDGEGLILRVQGRTASWVFKYRVASGKRRELGLVAVDRTSIEAAGASLTGAREPADEAVLYDRLAAAPWRHRLQSRCEKLGVSENLAKYEIDGTNLRITRKPLAPSGAAK